MLNDEQKKELEMLMRRFIATLDKEQLTQLYFRLDDLYQYGPEARVIFTKIVRDKIETWGQKDKP